MFGCAYSFIVEKMRIHHRVAIFLALSVGVAWVLRVISSYRLLGSSSPGLNPVILFPGDGGSQFEAQLDKPAVLHAWCKQKTDWLPLWLDLEFLLPGATACFVDNMKLRYDATTHTTSNQPGVSTRIPGFGNTSSVEYMDTSRNMLTSYYANLVDHLVSTLGYVRGVSIRGAPYDFRKAPNEMGDYIKSVIGLVEETYAANGERRVVLLGHSLGTLYVLFILKQQSQAWKDKHIHAFVSIGGPYGGAVKIMKMFTSGYDLNIIGLDEVTIREEQRSNPSSAWMLPYDTFWRPDEVLISAPTGNYSVGNYAQFFEDINDPNGLLMRRDTEPLLKDLKAPGVEVHCLYGEGVPTPESYVYTPVRVGTSAWYDWQPHTTVNGDGDGSVNRRSLLACQRWSGEQKFPVHLKGFPKAEHLKMIRSDELISHVTKVLQA